MKQFTIFNQLTDLGRRLATLITILFVVGNTQVFALGNNTSVQGEINCSFLEFVLNHPILSITITIFIIIKIVRVKNKIKISNKKGIIKNSGNITNNL